MRIDFLDLEKEATYTKTRVSPLDSTSLFTFMSEFIAPTPDTTSLGKDVE